MLKAHHFAFLAISATICLGLYTYRPVQNPFNMSKTKHSSQADIQPQVRLEIASINTVDSIPKVQLVAHVSNPSSETPITILRWNSVLDPQAGRLGTISLRNRNGGKALEVPSIMINRKMPPPKEEYIRIAPGGSTSNTITLALATSKLESGGGYEALAEGQFMEVYHADAEEPQRVVPYSCDPVHFSG
ncbi:uncharacterized protein AB675_5780 [Cyphellophora attinorum]|uniref:Uncharacterized protein n=1 Tax=Cyphellophora attinorum TaxID=1664694 RepID=A0A0N1NY57_9EURO|nr:uncharacterized protein AB675_5780 [Phialophora attinorum]KPI38767.1 hypothetical protein AB675_5780 [Phialophora attinorum]